MSGASGLETFTLPHADVYIYLAKRKERGTKAIESIFSSLYSPIFLFFLHPPLSKPTLHKKVTRDENYPRPPSLQTTVDPSSLLASAVSLFFSFLPRAPQKLQRAFVAKIPHK